MAAAVLAACGARTPAAQPVENTAQSSLQQIPLTVRSGRTSHRFTVEVAETRRDQAQGLMYRRALEPNRGMLFIYNPPQQVAFWMKNTLIPLDMIFIRADGEIVKIQPDTVPLSLEPVSSGEPILAVLEIPGGRSAELGIKAGDRVEWGR